jgi:stage III sporulation protein AD
MNMTVMGIGLIAAAICILLRQYKPEYALFVSLMAGAAMLALLLGDIESVLGEITAMLSSGLIEDSDSQILIKALGICFLTQIACDTCKDAGEAAISSKLEIAGKIAVLAVSLPLFRQVLSFVSTLMSN